MKYETIVMCFVVLLLGLLLANMLKCECELNVVEGHTGSPGLGHIPEGYVRDEAGHKFSEFEDAWYSHTARARARGEVSAVAKLHKNSPGSYFHPSGGGHYDCFAITPSGPITKWAGPEGCASIPELLVREHEDNVRPGLADAYDGTDNGTHDCLKQTPNGLWVETPVPSCAGLSIDAPWACALVAHPTSSTKSIVTDCGDVHTTICAHKPRLINQCSDAEPGLPYACPAGKTEVPGNNAMCYDITPADELKLSTEIFDDPNVRLCGKENSKVAGWRECDTLNAEMEQEIADHTMTMPQYNDIMKKRNEKMVQTIIGIVEEKCEKYFQKGGHTLGLPQSCVLRSAPPSQFLIPTVFWTLKQKQDFIGEMKERRCEAAEISECQPATPSCDSSFINDNEGTETTAVHCKSTDDGTACIKGDQVTKTNNDIWDECVAAHTECNHSYGPCTNLDDGTPNPYCITGSDGALHNQCHVQSNEYGGVSCARRVSENTPAELLLLEKCGGSCESSFQVGDDGHAVACSLMAGGGCTFDTANKCQSVSEPTTNRREDRVNERAQTIIDAEAVLGASRLPLTDESIIKNCETSFETPEGYAVACKTGPRTGIPQNPLDTDFHSDEHPVCSAPPENKCEGGYDALTNIYGQQRYFYEDQISAEKTGQSGKTLNPDGNYWGSTSRPQGVWEIINELTHGLRKGGRYHEDCGGRHACNLSDEGRTNLGFGITCDRVCSGTGDSRGCDMNATPPDTNCTGEHLAEPLSDSVEGGYWNWDAERTQYRPGIMSDADLGEDCEAAPKFWCSGTDLSHITTNYGGTPAERQALLTARASLECRCCENAALTGDWGHGPIDGDGYCDLETMFTVHDDAYYHQDSVSFTDEWSSTFDAYLESVKSSQAR